jgi:type 1 fimbriae regulatory protein FimB/type 1 fimbriae regulatory protein FimE
MPAILKLVEPASDEVLVTVANPKGGRGSNKEMGRSREYLDGAEVERLRSAAKKRRNGMRDELMIYMAARHGFRADELVALKRSELNLERHSMHVARLGGVPTTHPLDSHEVRVLGRLFKQDPHNPYVFVSERGTRMTRAGFQRVVEQCGEEAKFGFPVHPHMLRHACGYRLANEGRNAFEIQQYLGHTSLEMTRKYCALAENRFRDW